MQAQYNDGRTEKWTGLQEDEARKMTAERALDPNVKYVEMANGEMVPDHRNRHQRRRDRKRNRQKRGRR